jgi:L-fuculose-phosphate aldolase
MMTPEGSFTENAARGALVDACLRMTALRLNTGRAGNASLRWHRGGTRGEGMLITPSALAYETMRAGDIVWLPLDIEEEELAREGAPGARAGVRPSSEWRLHRDAYLAREEAGALVHSHSPAATSLSCLPAIHDRGIPAFHYMVAVAGGADIRCAPYRTFGTAALSEVAMVALADRRACLLANHGVVALGATLDAALELAADVESLAAMYATTLQLGEPAVLSGEEMARVLERFRSYRAASG